MHHFNSIGEFKLELLTGNPQLGSKSDILVRCDLEIWLMTLKNKRVPLLCYVKLCASFQSHWLIQTEVTFWKHSIRVKIGYLLPRVTLKFERWPWKSTGNLFYATSSIVHHFIKISDFKLELQSGNAKFRSKLAFFPMWPWNLMDDLGKKIRHLSYATSSFVHHFIRNSEFKLEFQSGNA